MPRGQVWLEVQSFCALLVAKKRVPDGLMATGRFFWREQGGERKPCTLTLLRVFNEAESSFPRSRMHALRELVGGRDATSCHGGGHVPQKKSSTVICSCKKERA